MLAYFGKRANGFSNEPQRYTQHIPLPRLAPLRHVQFLPSLLCSSRCSRLIFSRLICSRPLYFTRLLCCPRLVLPLSSCPLISVAVSISGLSVTASGWSVSKL